MNPSSDFRPGLKPPQFSLRTLLLLVTLCAVVFALINVLPPMVIAGLIFLIISIVAHVAGNAIGTRLRENGNRPVDVHGVPATDAQLPCRVSASRFAPQTQLSQRRSLGWPVLVATGAGFIAGGCGGGVWTAYFSGPRVAELNVAVGSVAFAVLGGFAAFLAFSFTQVGWGALRQSLGSHPSADDANG